MTAEQRERMLQNRLLAEERRNARLKRAQELKEKYLASQALKQITLSSQGTPLDNSAQGMTPEQSSEVSSIDIVMQKDTNSDEMMDVDINDMGVLESGNNTCDVTNLAHLEVQESGFVDEQ